MMLWIIDHDGDCWMLHSSGAFQRYKGVPTDSGRIQAFLMQLEGLLRRLPEDVERCQDELLKAIHRMWNDDNKNDQQFKGSVREGCNVQSRR